MVVGTPGENKITEGGVSLPADPNNVIGTSHYPSGLSLHVDHESLRKLGVEDHHDMPRAGKKFHVEAYGHIEHAQHEEGADGVVHRHMRLQITHMGMEHEDGEDEPAERDHAARLYGPKG